MLNAIGSPTYSFSPAGSGASTADLEAKLARYQKVLSECVSCDSAKTREGQEAIKEVSCQIGEIKARIEKITLAKSDTPNTATPADISANRGALASGAQGNISVAAVSASGSVTVTLGNRLNVFA